MTTADKAPPSSAGRLGAAPWREVMQSGDECAGAEAFALEHLVDLQRARAPQAGAGR